MPSGKPNKRIAALIVLAAAFAAFFIVRVLVDSGSWCAFRTFTGLPCPGCGLTSAGVALLRGNWIQSLKFHPFLIPVLCVIGIAIFYKRIPILATLYKCKWLYLIFLILFIGFYIVRLILFFPNGPYPMVYISNSLAGKVVSVFTTAESSDSAATGN